MGDMKKNIAQSHFLFILMHLLWGNSYLTQQIFI